MWKNCIALRAARAATFQPTNSGQSHIGTLRVSDSRNGDAALHRLRMRLSRRMKLRRFDRQNLQPAGLRCPGMMMIFSTQRHIENELMDDPALAPSAHAAALRGLRRINVMSRTAASLWPAITRIATGHATTPSLLDVACGGGDVAVALARRAQAQGMPLDVFGCDMSPVALEQATSLAHDAGLSVEFFRWDAVNDPLSGHYTIITATLFLHHLTDEQIIALLRRLAAHADHLIVSDLLRGPIGYALAWFGTRLLSTSRVVHVDGMRSVRAAVTMPEAKRLAEAAGLHGAHFQRRWPQRFLMTWARRKTSAQTHHAV